MDKQGIKDHRSNKKKINHHESLKPSLKQKNDLVETWINNRKQKIIFVNHQTLQCFFLIFIPRID